MGSRMPRVAGPRARAGGRSRALESSTRATRAFERDAASVERAIRVRLVAFVRRARTRRRALVRSRVRHPRHRL